MTGAEQLFDDVLVQKYGGSSVATPEKIQAVAGRIGDALKPSAHVVVAVSAMGKTTDQLISMAREVSPSPRGREMDLLLASGEQIAVSMVGLALQARGIAAVSLTANQCGIHTDGSFNKARVRSVETPDALMLSPTQAYFLRENLKLKLLHARLALLSRQVDTARAELLGVTASLNRYFDPASRRTQAAATVLQQLQGHVKTVETPRIDDTLAALATAAAGR
jgi:hypothetical protein